MSTERVTKAMADYSVSACTDITGFGFLGHLAEMVVDSGLGIHIQSEAVPILQGLTDSVINL